jgi:hypothetical protein
LHSLIIYTEKITPRLEYICKFLFEEVLHIPFAFLTKLNEVPDYCFINYSPKELENGLQIIPHSLLFEEGIATQKIELEQWNSLPIFFATKGTFIRFDIFAASFFLLTRYEEYGSTEKDIHDRFPHIASLAFKEGFLQKPLINLWSKHLWKGLQYFLPKIEQWELPKQYSIVSYDIDIAYSYQNKGFLRNLGGLAQDLKSFKLLQTIERLLCLLRLKPDPYDSFEYLKNIHFQTQVPAIYFFLLAEKRSQFDKNLGPEREAMTRLLAAVSQYSSIGIHPSYDAWRNAYKLRKEIKILGDSIDEEISASRQHYIRIEYPETFLHIQRHGIKADYSLGYGSINGFRASTGHPHYFFSVTENKVYPLRICPFSWMDANSKFEQKQNITTTEQEINHYIDICKLSNTPLIVIWHNYSLGTAREWEGWQQLHSLFMQKIKVNTLI